MAYINAGISCPICGESFAYEFNTEEFENMDGWLCVDIPCKNCGIIVSLSTWVELYIDDIQNYVYSYSEDKWVQEEIDAKQN